MAAQIDEVTPVEADKPYMVSSLPLVISGGQPMSVDNMPEAGLVTFVRFMLKCALNVGEHQLRLVKRPPWWPRTVPYFNFRARREVEKGHSGRLRDLVRSCYHGNHCEFLLQFCTDLEHPCAAGRMFFKNNFDGTSSLYERQTDRLVVTCRNENLEYDGAARAGPAASPRRHLLPSLLRRSSMVQPPAAIQDIYLCDHCSAEFTSIRQVQKHERSCGPAGDVAAAGEAAELSDAESVHSEPGAACLDQTRFMHYFGLQPAAGSNKQPYESPSKQTCIGGSRQRRVITAQRGAPMVDLSSPLGRRLTAHWDAKQPGSGPASVPPELYCDTAERKRSGRQPTFLVTWRPLRKRGRVVQRWTHQLSFTRNQRRHRLLVIRTGLTASARRLLRTAPVPCSVPLTRLTEAVITEACRERTPPPQPEPPEPPQPEPPESPLPVAAVPAPASARLLRPSVNGAGRARRSGPPPARNGRHPGATSGAGPRRAATRSSAEDPEWQPDVEDPEWRPDEPPRQLSRKPIQAAPAAAQLRSTIVLPRGVSITPLDAQFGPSWRRPQMMSPAQLQRRAGAVGWRPPLLRPVTPRAPLRIASPAVAAAAAAAQRTRPQVPVAPSGGPITIDLCSSSDEDEPSTGAAAPSVQPHPTIVPKVEPSEAATNCTPLQPKNVRSHWPVSWGCSANGDHVDTPSARLFASCAAGVSSESIQLTLADVYACYEHTRSMMSKSEVQRRLALPLRSSRCGSVYLSSVIQLVNAVI